MSEKYHASTVLGNHLPRIITNDLYLAAFLLCQGAQLCSLVQNSRRRLSFVFAGENVRHLRKEYEDGTVRLNMRSFKEHLISVRRRMDAEQRSAVYGPNTGSGVGTAQA